MKTTEFIPETTHPSPQLLAEFVRGCVEESRLGPIERHLDQCAECCRQVAELSRKGDRFTEQLIAAVAVETPVSRMSSTNRGSSHKLHDKTTDPDRSEEFSNPILPSVVGRFQVLEKVGSGGFGIVLRAFDPNLRREVAVKIPRHGDYLADDMRERFVREAQAAAALDHPHIVRIYEAVCQDGSCYITAAYCTGPNLSEWLKRQHEPVPLKTAVTWMRSLADAVDHAHRRGVLHRDLKPSNVLLDGDGLVPKISDFGLAKIQGEGPQSTRSHVVMGTPAYMSPEQACGHAKDVGHQTDVYSLGAIFYELLTGRPPLVGETEVDTLLRVQQEDPIAPSRLRPGLPLDLETICLCCLQKEPRHRYATAEALAEDLGRFLHGEPILARPVSRPELVWRWCRRKPLLATMSASIAALLIALVGGSMTFAVKLEKARTTAVSQLDQTREAERQAEHQLFSSLVAQGRSRRLSGHAGQRFVGQQVLRDAAKLSRRLELGPEELLELRNEVIACLALTDLRPDKTWPGYPPGSADSGIAFDSKLERYAMIDPSGYLVVRRMGDNSELGRIDLKPPLARSNDWRLLLAFSPGDRLIAARGDRIGIRRIPTRVWNWETGELILSVPHDRDGVGRHFDFSPDDQEFAVGQGDSVAIHNLQTKQVRVVCPGAKAEALRFDPSGHRLVICSGHRLRTFDLASNTWTHDLDASSHVSFANWSRDGELLAGGCADGHIRVWHAASGKLVATLAKHQNNVIHVAFNDRGDQIVSTSYDGTTRIWDLATGTSLLVERGAAGAFSRDGKWLAAGLIGSTLGRWEVARSDVLRKLVARPGQVLDTAVDPAGAICVALGSAEVSFVDIQTGQEVHRVPLEIPGLISSLAVDNLTNSFVTTSRIGVHRWPIECDENRVLHIGPPRRIEIPGAWENVRCDDVNADHLVIRTDTRVAVVKPSATSEPLSSVRHPGVYVAACTNNGRWLATSAWQGYYTRVWDVATGKLVREFPGRSARVAFSPDSKYLVNSTPDGYSIIQVDTWRLVRKIDRVDAGGATPMAFSQDSRLMAVAPSHTIELYEFPSCRQLASLAPPVQENISILNFSPHNDQLFVQTSGGTLLTWDLRLLREELAQLGLDWDMPKTSLAERRPVVRIDVDPGEFGDVRSLAQQLKADPQNAELYLQRGRAYAGLQQWEAALADFAQAAQRKPDLVEAYLHSGEILNRTKQFSAAVILLTRAIQQRPALTEAIRTRGHAFVGQKDWPKAIADFQRIADDDSSWRSWFDLGMAQMNGSEFKQALHSLENAGRLQADRNELSATFALRGRIYERLGDFPAAMNQFRRAYELEPEQERNGAQLAWALAAYPNSGPSDWLAAVALSERAIHLSPPFPDAWRGLGVAKYRLSEWSSSRAALEESNRLRGADDPYTHLFMAMLEASQDRPDIARQHLAQATAKEFHEMLFGFIRRDAEAIVGSE